MAPNSSPDSRSSHGAPSRDPAEALERIVPRGNLKLEEGDIVIMRAAGGFRSPSLNVYEVHVHGRAERAERFAQFETAAIAAEQLASARRARLLYTEGTGEPPRFLNDFRTARNGASDEGRPHDNRAK